MRATTSTCCLAAVAWATSALAQTAPEWMADADLRTTFAGVTISGIYIDGVKFTESYAENGRIAYQDPRKSLAGHWSVVNRSFCTLYDDVVAGGCFKVSRHSANCFEFYFVAGTETEADKPGEGRPNWTARGWNQAKPATCDEKPAV